MLNSVSSAELAVVVTDAVVTDEVQTVASIWLLWSVLASSFSLASSLTIRSVVSARISSSLGSSVSVEVLLDFYAREFMRLEKNAFLYKVVK